MTQNVLLTLIINILKIFEKKFKNKIRIKKTKNYLILYQISKNIYIIDEKMKQAK